MDRFLKLLFFAFLFTVLIACSQKHSADIPEDAINPDVVDNPVTPRGDSEVESMLPVFEFLEEEFDFGSIKEGETISHSFKFKNSGKSDLVITSASGSCGCTVPEWPKEAIAPGKEGVIDISFNSEGKTGMQHKTVTLIANTIPNSKVLTIKGEVIPK
jgi:hypothetical protein